MDLELARRGPVKSTGRWLLLLLDGWLLVVDGLLLDVGVGVLVLSRSGDGCTLPLLIVDDGMWW